MATKTSTTSGNWSSGSTWVGGVKPADGDAVVIAAGHSVLMDEDQSAFSGLVGVTIQGSATTPGMLYWKDGTNGHLKIAGGYTILGTSGANKGRLLVNSDGVWDNTGELSISNTAIIEFSGTSTSNRINAVYLEMYMYAQTPTYKAVVIYGTKYDATASTDVDVDNDSIDWGTTPPSAGTRVTIMSTGDLPDGIKPYAKYYVRNVSGNTCKLAWTNSDTTVIDITGTGTGTISMLTASSGGTTLNMYDDVSGDSTWTTTSGMNVVYIADALRGDSTQVCTRTTMSTITSSSITVADSIAAMSPGAQAVLASRNVQIIFAHNSTSGYGIFDLTGDSANYSYFNGQLYSSGGSGIGFYSTVYFQFEGVMDNWYYGTYANSSFNFDGAVNVSTIISHASDIIEVDNSLYFSCTYVSYSSNNMTFRNTRFHNCDYVTLQGYCDYVHASCVNSGNYAGARSAGVMECDIYNCTYGLMGGGVDMYGDLCGITSYAVYAGNHNIYGATFYGNNYDFLSYRAMAKCYSCLFPNTITDIGSYSYDMPGYHVISWDHNGIGGHVRAYTRGGYTVVDPTPPGTPPVDLDFTHSMYQEATTTHSQYHWIYFPIQTVAGKLLRITVYVKCNSAPSTWADGPRFQIVDPVSLGNDVGVSQGVLVEKVAETDGGDDTNWHTLVLEYRPATSKILWLRAIAKRVASDRYDWNYELQNASSYALQFRGV